MAYDTTLSILIIIIFILLYFGTILGINYQNIKKNWLKYRCNPMFIPIAGLFGVNTANNNSECAAAQQSSLMDTLLEPIRYTQKNAIMASQQNTTNIEKTKTEQVQQKNTFTYLTGNIFNKMNNISIEFNRMGLSMKDIMNRIFGIFTVAFYIFKTLVNSIESNINMIREACFVHNTIIQTKEGPIYIQDIKPGTILSNDSIVTSTMLLDGSVSQFYSLDKTIVTGNHKVYFNDQWIDVKDNPFAISLPEFKADKVYCLNTTSKTININNTIFSDWDDIDKDDLKILQTDYPNLTFDTIHKFLENGLHKDTLIELDNKTKIPIKDITLGTILYNNIKVIGLVKIDGHNQSIYNHNGIIGTKNILTSLNLEKEEDEEELFHLITDTKYFIINNIQLYDYNGVIESYF